MNSNRESIRYSPRNPPPSIDIAEEGIERLTEKIQGIDMQLSNRERINPDTGEEWSREEYNVWKQRALCAKMFATRELKFLKRWTREERARYNAHTINVDFNNPKSLIHAAYRFMMGIRIRVDLTEEEKLLANTLHEYLQHK